MYFENHYKTLAERVCEGIQFNSTERAKTDLQDKIPQANESCFKKQNI